MTWEEASSIVTEATSTPTLDWVLGKQTQKELYLECLSGSMIGSYTD